MYIYIYIYITLNVCVQIYMNKKTHKIYKKYKYFSSFQKHEVAKMSCQTLEIRISGIDPSTLPYVRLLEED